VFYVQTVGCVDGSGQVIDRFIPLKFDRSDLKFQDIADFEEHPRYFEKY
jgi:hypothetical protein